MGKIIILAFFLMAPFTLWADDQLSDQVIREKAIAFLDAKDARQQPDTQIKDIDHFISLLADTFIDEHIKYNVTVTDKAKLRLGMISKMEDDIIFSNLTIDQIMVGPNVAFVKYTEHQRGSPSHLNKEIEYKSTSIMSLEFNEEGLITHIRRHN